MIRGLDGEDNGFGTGDGGGGEVGDIVLALGRTGIHLMDLDGVGEPDKEDADSDHGSGEGMDAGSEEREDVGTADGVVSKVADRLVIIASRGDDDLNNEKDDGEEGQEIMGCARNTLNHREPVP